MKEKNLYPNPVQFPGKIDLNKTWCTDDIEALRNWISDESFKMTKKNRKIINHVFYKGNPRIRASGLNFAYTREETLAHYPLTNPVEFAKELLLNVKLRHLNFNQISLNDNQEEIIEAHFIRLFNVSILPRQAGTTTAIRCIALYEAIIEARSVDVISSNLSGVSNNINTIMAMIESMPYWLQSGIVKVDDRYIQFENGGIIRCNIVVTSQIQFLLMALGLTQEILRY